MVLEIKERKKKEEKKKENRRGVVLSLSMSLNHSLSWNECFFVKRGDLKTVEVEALLVRHKDLTAEVSHAFVKDVLQIVSCALCFHGGNTQGFKYAFLFPQKHQLVLADTTTFF